MNIAIGQSRSAGHAGVAGTPVCIVGTGSCVPERVLTNADLEKMVETSDEWIVTRTGIKERRIAAPNQAASDLGAEAARKALSASGLNPAAVDMIVTATISPDMPFPNTSCLIQKMIGAGNAFCFDIEAACSGYIYAIEIARQFLASGSVKTALVIASEKLSAFVDWEDRNTCVLFGDGAGAAVLQVRPSRRGILSCVMASDGSLSHLLTLPAGGSRMPPSEDTVRNRQHFIKMAGQEVFKHAVTCMSAAAVSAMERAGVAPDQIKCLIPHQANMRIIQATAERVGIPPERCFTNIGRYGNMSAASIAVALDEAVREGAVKHGDIVLLVVFGGGFTWGATVFEY